MTPAPRWVGKDSLLILHSQSIARFGGVTGLRDEGLLDSARARPRNAHSYTAKSSIAQLVASDAFGLAKNPPFVEDNKRAALLAPGVCPALNPYLLTASQREATTAIRRRAN